MEYTRLADWQAATGHDAHSVWLTDAQAAAFFLGDPREGDARINPAAEVTAADGTVYVGTFPDGTPITEAGPQAHWDFSRHAPAPGPPTRWPVAPRTLDDAKRYVRDPRAWDFYPPLP